jgi:ATP-dependent Clp protease ATP-binding subunit ClpB
VDLDKISPDLESALDEARHLAESNRQSQISPLHLIYVLLNKDGSLGWLPARVGVDIRSFLHETFAKLCASPHDLRDGVRPRASRDLRELIQAAVALSDKLRAEQVEPIQLLLALLEEKDSTCAKELWAAGFEPSSVEAAVRTRHSLEEAIHGNGKAKPAIGGRGSLETLRRFAKDLTEAAAAGDLMPIIGRDYEVRRLIQTLLRKTKNNPVLVGDPGTGKTAIVEGLAARIVAGDVPESLKPCRIFALDLVGLVAGTKLRGEFEQRLKAVVEEVQAESGRIMLFLDELHTLVGAGGTEGGMDAANILKPALARGQIRCIGATTYDEYREKIEKDAALARRFDLITVKEPENESVMAILRGIRPRYESFHGVRLSDEALQAAVMLSRRYIRNRFFPDKAIDVIDEATARLRMQRESKPNSIDELERSLLRKEAELTVLKSNGKSRDGVESLTREIDDLRPRLQGLTERWRKETDTVAHLQRTKAAIEDQQRDLAQAESQNDVAKAAQIRYGSLCFLERQLVDLEGQVAELPTPSLVPSEVDASHIAEVVAERSGIPISRLMESERERLLHLEDRMSARVIGQQQAVNAVAGAVRRMRTDLRIGQRPASFLFVGPTGVGKTELAKSLAEALFDDESALIRIDMGEYKDQSAVSGLIGSRPGLVGSDEGGFLTERVRRLPYSVVLFDEVEKAHPQVLDLLLAVLDEGRLSDAKGRFCDFSNVLIIFTSNLGVREASELTDDPSIRGEIILEAVKQAFRPEFFNRIAEVVLFDTLTVEETDQIVSLQLNQVQRKLEEERNIHLQIDAAATRYLAERAYDPIFGARPVTRLLQQVVLSPLAIKLLSGDVQAGDTIVVTTADGELRINTPVMVAAEAC